MIHDGIVDVGVHCMFKYISATNCINFRFNLDTLLQMSPIFGLFIQSIWHYRKIERINSAELIQREQKMRPTAASNGKRSQALPNLTLPNTRMLTLDARQ